NGKLNLSFLILKCFLGKKGDGQKTANSMYMFWLMIVIMRSNNHIRLKNILSHLFMMLMRLLIYLSNEITTTPYSPQSNGIFGDYIYFFQIPFQQMGLDKYSKIVEPIQLLGQI
ncbi:hypothetical protein ACJX0J_032293, partial [Zea mays]